MTAPSKIPLIIVCGGSGSGKTTLAQSLAARNGWSLAHLDDYRAPKERLRRMNGHRNWDEPNAVDFPMLRRDLDRLQAGVRLEFLGRPQTESRDGDVHELRVIEPRPRIVLEGFLALWHPAVRALASYAIFLDAPAEIRHARRRWKMAAGYVTEVLEPMHRLYVEPAKAHADAVLDAAASAPDDLVARAEALIAAGRR